MLFITYRILSEDRRLVYIKRTIVFGVRMYVVFGSVLVAFISARELEDGEKKVSLTKKFIFDLKYEPRVVNCLP